MLDRIKQWLTVLDLPSGVVMGVVTMTMLCLMVAAFVLKRSIDGTILTCYGLIIVPFAAHKTTTATTAIVTKSTTGEETNG